MEFNEYNEIKNKVYSPKEVLAHLLIASKEVIGESGKILIDKLTSVFIKNIKNKDVLENVNIKSLEKIKNYWGLSIGQAIAYGYIVFSNLNFENKSLTEDEITNMFVFEMQIYSPDNAVEFVERKEKGI